jgi:hypothetical protein
MIPNFNEYMKLSAICIYLKSFGYVSTVCTVRQSVRLWLDNQLFTFSTWDSAREFIKVCSQD